MPAKSAVFYYVQFTTWNLPENIGILSLYKLARANWSRLDLESRVIKSIGLKFRLIAPLVWTLDIIACFCAVKFLKFTFHDINHVFIKIWSSPSCFRQFYEKEKDKLVKYWSPPEQRKRAIKRIKRDVRVNRFSGVRRQMSNLVRLDRPYDPSQIGPALTALPPINDSG